MKALLLDTETTGLITNGLLPDSQRPEIVELYMCRADLDTGEIDADFEMQFKPSFRIRQKAAEVHGLTAETLANKGKFATFGKSIIAWLEVAPLIIAHNASFDKEMFDIEASRIGHVIQWPSLLCTIEQTMHIKGYRLSLTNLYDMLFGEKFKDAHRAKSDVMALLRCCVELRKRGVL